MTFAERMRKLGRASGYLAIAAVVLWGVMGIVFLNRAGTVTPPTSETAAVGGSLPVNGGNLAVWGTGDPLDPTAVQCSWTTDGGRTVTADPATVDSPRPQTSDDELGDVTMIALVDDPWIDGKTMTCTGGGLEGWALGPASDPSSRGVGIGFLVGAGFAALWAVVALRVTRPAKA